MFHASASRPHWHMLVVVVEHPGKQLGLASTNVLLRGRAEVSSLFGDRQLAIVGDAEFDGWDGAEVILVRPGTDVVLPLGVAPPIRRVLHELIVTVAVDLRNEAESTVDGVGVGVAGERTEGTIVW